MVLDSVGGHTKLGYIGYSEKKLDIDKKGPVSELLNYRYWARFNYN